MTEREWPPVSVVVPALNEEPHLRDAVERVLANGYRGELEVVVAVGPSRDGTARVAAELAAEHPNLAVVDNPSGRTPQALNAAIAASHHDVVVRIDAHGFLPHGYVQRAVEVLEETGAANVGGQMVPEGVTPFGRAVARAMSTRLGIGGAPFHVGGQPGPAESVYLGVFRRAVLEQVGGFDEHFARAQDWELNYRIRETGGVVWFDPALQVTYRPRSTFRALATQFFGSGRWRREVVGRYPHTASPRYLAAPLAVVGVGAGLLATLLGLLTRTPWLLLGAALPVGYLLLVLLGSLLEGRRLPVGSWVRLPAVVVVMHMSWGAGFLRGTPTGAPQQTTAPRVRPFDVQPGAAPQGTPRP